MNTQSEYELPNIKFDELHAQLIAKNRPEFGFVIDPNVPIGLVSINQSHDAVVHPDDVTRLQSVVIAAGWIPINQT